MVYYGLKKGVGSITNVSVEIPYEPYFIYDSFGQKALGTHGDTVFSPGNPGAALDIRGIRAQVNEWNARLSKEDQISLFFVGHVHTPAQVALPSGARFISNGCLVPTDDYGISKGMPNVTCGQWLWEAVPGHIVGDSRLITINEEVYNNDSLDVIQPFEKF
jgi:3',5'-cyclic AMP phosphodiesterase CpdA